MELSLRTGARGEERTREARWFCGGEERMRDERWLGEGDGRAGREMGRGGEDGGGAVAVEVAAGMEGSSGGGGGLGGVEDEEGGDEGAEGAERLIPLERLHVHAVAVVPVGHVAVAAHGQEGGGGEWKAVARKSPVHG